MARVAITGSSGKLGRAVVEHLHHHGWDVVALDRASPVRSDIVSTQVDLTDFGQTCEAVAGIDDRHDGVMYHEDYDVFPSFDADAHLRKWNLWGYIDARDGAQAVRRALEHDSTGTDVFIIANAYTVMSRPNEELLAEVFPAVPVKPHVGPNETLLSIDKARRVLGYEPRFSWRTPRSGS